MIRTKIVLLAILLVAIPSLSFGAACWHKYEDVESGFARYPAESCASAGCAGAECCIASDNWGRMGISMPDTGAPSTDYARAGTYSLKIFHDFDNIRKFVDPTNVLDRTEYFWADWYDYTQFPGNGKDTSIEIHYPPYPYAGAPGIFWYSFSVLFPAGWTAPSDESYIITQLHTNFDTGTGTTDTVTNPPFAISVQTDGSIKATVRGSDDHYMTSYDYSSSPTLVTSIATDTWYDFVIKGKIDYGGTGYLYIWVNEGGAGYTQKVALTDKIIGYYNTCPYCGYWYPKIGVYTWYWNDTYYPTKTVSTISSSTITTSTTAFATGTYVGADTTDTYPTGLAVSGRYYVRQASGSTFKLATTNSDTTIISIGSSWSGTLTVYSRPLIDEITVYFDEIKLGDSTCVYEDMIIQASSPSVTGCTISGGMFQ